MTKDIPHNPKKSPFGDEFQGPVNVPERAVEGPQREKRTPTGPLPAPAMEATRHAPSTRKDVLFRRRELAAALSARGWSYSRIGQRLGVSQATAHYDVGEYHRQAARFFDAPAYRERIGSMQWEVASKAYAEFRRLNVLDEARRAEGKPPLYVSERLACLEQISKTMERVAKMYGMTGEGAVSITNLLVSNASGDTVERSIFSGLQPEQRKSVRDRLIELQNDMLPSVTEADVQEQERAERAEIEDGGGE